MNQVVLCHLSAYSRAVDIRAPTTARFSVFFLFFWGGIIALEGFMVPYLSSIGFSERQAGLIMAAIFLVSIGSAPLWGYIADRTDRHREIIALALAVAIAAVLAIFGSGTSFGLIIFFALIYSLTGNSMPALIDSWIMRISRTGSPISYGIARGFGSLGFAATGAVLGIVLQRHGLALLFPIYGAVTVVVLLITITTRPQKRLARSEDGELAATVSAGAALRAVLTNGRYLVLVASCFFVLLGTRSALVFLPLRLYALGGTTIHVGWAQAVSAGSEMPFMFLSVFVLRRVRPRLLLLGAMVFFVVRLVFVRLAATPGALVAVQAIQGISVGFLLPAVIHYIDRISPPEYRSLFQTLAPAIYFGLASVVGSSAGGVIIERFGLDALYIGAPIAAAVGVLLFGGSLLLGRRGRQP